MASTTRGGRCRPRCRATDDQGRPWTTHTDPATGAYRLDLLPDTAYTLRASAVYPGYPAVSRRVSVGSGAHTEDVVLTVALTCAAPEYQASYTGPVERFAGGRPAGWSVVDVDHRLPGYDHRPGWPHGNTLIRSRARLTDPGRPRW